MNTLISEKYNTWKVLFEKPILFNEYPEIDTLLDIGNQFIEEAYFSEDNCLNETIEFLGSNF